MTTPDEIDPEPSVRADPPPSQPAPFDPPIGRIQNGTDTAPKTITLRQALEEVRSNRHQLRVENIRSTYASEGKDACAELKRKLPGYLFSGTFTHRSKSHLEAHSGLICVDLDNLPDPEATKEQVAQDPHTLAAFLSPTGTGLKVIFKVDPSDHAAGFAAARAYCKNAFGLQIDEACKDVCRICYASHDPDLFEAADATPLPQAPPEPREHRPLTPLGLDLRPGDDFDLRGDLPALLRRHGWTEAGDKKWRRPDKSTGQSASLDYIPGRFYCFTSSTQFEPGHVYKPWHVYAILEHGGDYSAATKALAGQGFGEQRRTKPQNPAIHAPLFSENSKTTPPPVIEARSLFDFALPLDGDTSILLGDRYLNRGDGAVIVSSSGMGKSAMTLQMATELALNKGPFGIRGNGPLSSLIVQSEDSDGDVAEVAHSLKHVLQLTPQDLDTVQSRVKIVTDRVNRGLTFIASLRQLIDLHKPDLVWVNPLQAFMDGDVTDSQDLGAFLRSGLNSLNQPARFGYIVVHHTTKPATGKERSERLWHEVMYDMAGGAEIINWARAIISLRPTANEGDFNLVLAKRGRRAGVTRAIPNGVGTILEPVTTIPVRHAKGRLQVPGIARGIPIIHWESRPEDTPETQQDHGRKGGRPPAHTFDTYAHLVPAANEPPLTVPQLARRFKDECPIKEPALYHCVKRWVKEGLIIAINSPGKPTTYRKPGSADF